MTTLDRIREVLERVAADGSEEMQGVTYGDRRIKESEKANYFVFNRLHTKKSSNKMDRQTFYQVIIVHEDYIPEGYVEKVIQELEKEDGTGIKLRVTDDDIPYDYTFKGKTDLVVEVATITLFRPEKRCR